MNSMKRTPTPLSRPNAREVDDLVVVDAAHHDRVHLHRREARVERGVDAGEHAVELVALGRARGTRSRCSESSDTLMRRSPASARSCASSGSRTPLVVIAMSTPSGASSCDEPGHVRPHERLAAGDADRLEAEALDADPGDPGDLLVGEQLLAGQPLHPLFGHAVGAAEVAAVGDRDPQILDAPRERIDQGNRRRPVPDGAERHRVRLGARLASRWPAWLPGVGSLWLPARRSDQLQPTDHRFPGCAASRQPLRVVALATRLPPPWHCISPARATPLRTRCTTVTWRSTRACSEP